MRLFYAMAVKAKGSRKILYSRQILLVTLVKVSVS